MMIVLTEWIGITAAICTTGSFIPQAVLVYKTQKTKDISLSMFVIFVIGLIFWLFYGIMLNATPIILANAITLIIAGYILIKKIKLG